MRLLIVNPNTSDEVTARIAAAAGAAAKPGDRFTTVSAVSGPRLIVTDEDTRAATVGVLDAVAQHIGMFDGIVIASFGDTGIAEVRACARVPVVGIARSAYAAASALGDRFALVSFAAEMAPSLRRTVEDYGLGGHLAGLYTVEGANWSSPGAIQDELHAPLRQLCIAAAAEPDVASIVLGGGPLAGLAARLQPHVPVPIIDGTTAAIALLRLALAGMPAACQAVGERG